VLTEAILLANTLRRYPDRGCEGHKELISPRPKTGRANGDTAQHRGLVAVEQALEARWSTVHRDTNDTKLMASDIGTIRKGRTVA
jgi:hypothetical protein